MLIFVLNAGSSSIKYQLFQMPEQLVLCVGVVERIGLPTAQLTHNVKTDTSNLVLKLEMPNCNHEAAFNEIVHILQAHTPTLKSLNEITIIGHRVLHGGIEYDVPNVITDAVWQKLQALLPLGPLHLPHNFKGVELAKISFPSAIQIAIFDTGFHRSIPAKAYRYAIPNKYYEQYGFRVYGFHGISHQYVSERAAAFLKNPKAAIISIHLGNGCSMAAIKDGKCLDTTMGFGPLNGLMMGTRSGDIDPTVIFQLIEKTGASPNEIQDMLNKQSGMVGICGFSDMRDVHQAILEGNQDAILAYEMFVYRIKKYIGAYIAILNGVDAIVFTGGIGENDALMRKDVLENMTYFGIHYQVNGEKVEDITIHSLKEAQSAILVIPTNEELAIAQQCYTTVEANLL